MSAAAFETHPARSQKWLRHLAASFPAPETHAALSLASPPLRTYNRRAMTKRSHVATSVYIFTVLLIGFFLAAVWGVLGMIGVVG